MCRDIERLIGNNSFRHISQLKSDDSFSADPLSIAEILAEHSLEVLVRSTSSLRIVADYQMSISASTRGSGDELSSSIELSQKISQLSFDLPQQQSISYNLPIPSDTLSITIHKNLKNESLGPDNIHSSMLRNLHPNSLSYLLTLFNATPKMSLRFVLEDWHRFTLSQNKHRTLSLFLTNPSL